MGGNGIFEPRHQCQYVFGSWTGRLSNLKQKKSTLEEIEGCSLEISCPPSLVWFAWLARSRTLTPPSSTGSTLCLSSMRAISCLCLPASSARLPPPSTARSVSSLPSPPTLLRRTGSLLAPP